MYFNLRNVIVICNVEFSEVFFNFCPVKLLIVDPCVLTYCKRELSQHQWNNKSLAMMDTVCSSEGAAEPRLSDLGYSLQESLLGSQCFLMLAEQKSYEGKQKTSEGFCII